MRLDFEPIEAGVAYSRRGDIRILIICLERRRGTMLRLMYGGDKE